MTSEFWTLDRIGDALAGSCVNPPRGQTAISGISTDTRAVAAGNCFVALSGDRFDGHNFLEQAVAAGAAALVVNPSRSQLGALNVPLFVVQDTLAALGELARYRRDVWGKPVVGIAGSNGKTSTKDLLSAALGSLLTVHATRGNLNNRVGVPLTLLALPDSADVAVVELGTSIPGEIEMLRKIAQPDLVVVTSIAEEHLEGLGDLAGVLAEESAVFDTNSVAVIPATHPELREPATRARKVVVAGLDNGDVRATSWSIAPDGSGTAVVRGVDVHSPLRGVHNLRNLMLALAASEELGVSTADAARGIAQLTPPPMRASWQKVGRALIINDAYNSNPGSALAALDMLASAPGSQRVAILGTMRELGANSRRYHDEVARAALASCADIIGGIGEFSDSLMRLAPAADPRVVTADDVDELWAALAPRLASEPTILLKASRGVKLERILPLISSWATQAC